MNKWGWLIIGVVVLVALGIYYNYGADSASADEEGIVNVDENSINKDSNEGSPSSKDPLCTDSDGGKNYNIKGETCNEVDCKVDACTSMPVRDNVVAEYYCEGNKRESLVGAFCDYKCEDGACILAEPKCTDTDGGIDYSVKGKVITENIPAPEAYSEFEDYCIDSEKIVENYCGPGQGMWEQFGEVAKADIYNCPNGCSDGACIYY